MYIIGMTSQPNIKNSQSMISSQGPPNSDFQFIVLFLLHSTIGLLSNWNGGVVVGKGEKEEEGKITTCSFLRKRSKGIAFLTSETHKISSYLQQTFF